MSQSLNRIIATAVALAFPLAVGCNSEPASTTTTEASSTDVSETSPTNAHSDSSHGDLAEPHDAAADDPSSLSFEQKIARDTLQISELEAKAQFNEALAQWNDIIDRLTRAHGDDSWQVRTAEVARGLTLQRSKLSIEHRNDMVSINDRERRGDRFVSLGQPLDALNMYTEGLELAAKVWGDDSPITLSLRSKVASQQEMLGDSQNALTSYLAVINGRELVFGANHPLSLEAVGNLARFHEHQGNFDLAVQHAMKRIAGTELTFGTPSEQLAESINDLGAIFLAANDWIRAERELSTALAMRRELFQGTGPEVAHSLRNLALSQMAQQRFESAEPLLTEAIAILEGLRQSESVAELKLKRGSCYLANEELPQAEADFSDARTTLEPVQDLAPVVFAEACFKHGYILGRLGRYEEAKPLLENALSLQQRHLPPDDPALNQTHQILGVVLSKLDSTRIGAEPTTIR